MAKFYNTTDDSIGAKELKNGKVLIARKIEGRNVLEILEDPQQIADILDKVLPVLKHIMQQLRDFFQSIFQRFPSVIRERDHNYIFTLQPCPGDGICKVFYMAQDDPYERIFECEHKYMGKAKSMLFKELKKANYVR